MTDQQGQFTEAMMKALMDTFMVEADGQRACMIDGAIVIETCITVMALVLRDSEGTKTPKAIREAAEDIGRRLKVRIIAAQRTASPFETIQRGMPI